MDAPRTHAEELRRRRTALSWTLEQVAGQTQIWVGMLSLIETGKRAPLRPLLAADPADVRYQRTG